MTKLKKTYCILSLIFAIAVFVAVLFASQNRTTVYAASMDPDSIDSLDNTAANTSTGSGSESDSKGGLSISINNDEAGVASEVRALLLLTIIAVSPSLLIMLTSYTRIVIVLHFLRTAIGTQTAPPNQILIGLALFLTFFIMWPTFQQINENAIQPLDNGDITIEEALKEAEVPIRQFMYGQVQRKDVKLFVDMAGDSYDIDSAALEKEYGGIRAECI